jgi:hypothetical protein
MSSISAGTTSGTALVSTADTTGALVLKTNGTTTALTLGADQTATFVGAVTAPSFSGTSATATNLAGGSAGTVPYQSAINTTQMLAAGTSGQSLLSSGAGAPTWGTPALATAATTATTATNATNATTSTNLAGGSNGTIPYQSASGTTQMLAAGSNGLFLQSSGAGAPVWAAAGASTNYAAKSTTYTAVAGDKGYLFGCTSTWTLSLTAAATLGNGWFLYLQNLGTGVITVDPDGSETIGGVTTAALRPGDIWLIVCDGTNFQLNRLGGSNYQIFTSSGTFTTPAGVYRIYAEAWGGGGGGAKETSAVPGSGAGGGYSAGFINTTPGATITATVAAGGAGATTNNTAGSAGGGSTFGALTANGGEQGKLGPSYSYTYMNSQGGLGSGGDVNIQGGSCLRFPIASINDVGSVGGAAPASGGQGGRIASNPGAPAGATQEPGIPGGGGYAGVGALGVNGATGGRGEIRVYWV